MRLQLAQKSRQTLTFVVALTALVIGLVAANPAGTAHAVTPECGPEAIMYCGFTSNQNFIDKVRGNNSGNGFKDLQAIYSYFNLKSDSYDRFVTQAKDGYLMRDNTIVVGGKVVGRNAGAIGRGHSLKGSDYKTININGVNYYWNYPSVTYASTTQSIPIKALFDSTGTLQFAVMPSCGNPVRYDAVKSSAVCNMLNKTQVSGKPNTYRFTTNASQTGNATLTRYVYEFGDGTPNVTTTSATTVVEHTYAKAGNFTAKVTVYASTPGGEIKASGTCQTVVTVPQPIAQCVQLTGVLVDKSKNSYLFTATAKYTEGATLVSADFDFGDGSKAAGIKPASATTITVSHDYGKEGTYPASATLRYTIYGQTVTAPACKTNISVIVPFYQCIDLKGPEPNNLTYTFVATAKYGNGAEFVSADFDFGDGKTTTGVKPSGSTATAQHTYEKAGTYSASAVLRFTVNGKTVTAPTCKAMVTPNEPPVPECKPGVPVGDLRCSPCQYDVNVPAGDSRCVESATTTLPNTGAGNVVVLASAALIGGFLYYRRTLFQRHKSAYLAAQRGSSPLPLGEPLNNEQPLAGTPFEPTEGRSRFGRRRQF